MRLLALAVPFVGLCTASGAFAPPQDVPSAPILSVSTDLVTLQVTVVDRRGEIVTGLGREDFTIYDRNEPQTIEFFGSGDVPVTVGLLIDSSGSMQARREAVTAAAAAFIAASHPGDEYFTLNFNERIWPGLPPGVAFTGDALRLRAALAAAPARGMTALYDAVDRGLDHLALGTRERKALIVVSDGGDNASSHKLDAVVERARRMDAVIYAVRVFDRDDHDANPKVLAKLARETGGKAFTPANLDGILAAFTRIAAHIRSGYTLAFSPAQTTGGFHPIRVAVNTADGRRLVARTRAGYHARDATR